MNDAISLCDTAIESGDASQIHDTALRIKPDFRDPDYNKVLMVNGNTSKEVSYSYIFKKTCNIIIIIII